MQHRESTFIGVNNTQIYYQYWQPEIPAHALIMVAHGAAEHSSRYNHFAEYFTNLGYVVGALDHIGHGKSEGARCCIRRFDDYIVNLETFRQIATDDYPGLPIFLVGHSMGGLISCAYLLKYQPKIKGCILSGPAIMSDMKPPWYQLFLIRLLARLTPNLGAIKLDASGISRDPAVVRDYYADPLNHTEMVSARMIVETIKTMATVQQHTIEISLPLLILHGSEDILAAPKGSEFLYQQAGSSDKQLKIYPGLFHEIFNEPEQAQVFLDIEQWLAERNNSFDL